MFKLSHLLLLAFSCHAAVVENSLQGTLEKDGTANIIVSMKGGNAAPLRTVRHQRFSSRTMKINALADTLEEYATESQAPVMSILNQRSGSFKYTSFWASNKVYIENATPELVSQLAGLDNVAEIHEEHIVTLEPIVETPFIRSEAAAIQWGIAKVQADKVWATGNQGQGIIVATTDTGVRVSHEILRHNYIGRENHGWYDPYQKTAEPNDQNGHGTHTMGTICGANGYGVAPKAKWMACKGCSTNRCTEAALLGCGQFTLCPTDTDGNNRDCSKAAHLSSNSWGGGANQPWYQETVDAWQEAGIIPIFALGNSGPRCGSANSPGDYHNVIGVGASTSGNGLASFSSVGPTKTGRRKPEVAAPGHQVASAWHNSDTGYKTISGTSMACPHTAGVIALMLSNTPDLKYNVVKNALTGSTNQNLQRPNKNCGNIQDDIYPNNMFGWGVVDAVGAIDSIGKPAPSPPGPSPPAPPPPGKPPGKDCVHDLIQRKCVPKDQCTHILCFGQCPCTN